jgi:hypothetical protein
MAPRRPPKRDEELSTRTAMRKKLLDVMAGVVKGFEDQRGRSDGQKDNWDLYNCKLKDKQFYNGNSKIFVPLVRDAVQARKTRFVNQLFPLSGRYVDVTTTDGEIPHATMSLLEHYVRKAQLRTKILPALTINGDCEGQYSLYVSWEKSSRTVTRREDVADQKIKGLPDDALADLGTHTEYITEAEVQGLPHVEVIADADLLILPVTVDTVDDAIEKGGSVTVIRRWSKAMIRQKIDSGDVVTDEGEALIKAMDSAAKSEVRDTGKDKADAAGIKSAGKETLIYEVWTAMKVGGDMRLVRAYYAGENRILGAKLCPYWCERPPVISVPVEKIGGVIKGQAPVSDVADLQVFANDTINQAADSALYSAVPIVMTDPEKNPRASTMTLDLGAVWETSPKDTQFAQFPELWRNGLERVEAIKQQIFQTLGVNPSMIPQSTGKPKRNQAEIAMEQQVDLLTTADAVTVLEEGVLTPLIQRFAEYDHQFREDPVTVRMFGEMGYDARMEDVEPLQLNNRWEFRWYGVDAQRNAAQQQQQIAGLNVIKAIPPNLYEGYELDMTPVIVQMTENLFGPRLAPKIFKKKQAITIPPDLENEMMEHGHVVETHQADDDLAHLQAHMQGMMASGGDPHGTFHDHIAKHQQQMQKKQAAMMQQQMAQGGGGGGKGPAPGAQPGQGRGMKGPPGQMHQDRMASAGVVQMPRKT